MSEHPLDAIFHPRAIALVGVSSGAASRGAGFLKSLFDAGFDRERVYPVNPKMEETSGVRCYPSLLDTPDPVDHVISLVPARAVPGLVDDCVAKGVRSLHLYTAGFSETGDAGMAAIERDMVAKLRAAGIRAVGPNCMGLYCPRSGLSWSGDFPKETGNVFLLSQSGANASEIVGGLARRGVRFSKAVSFGNGADLKAQDFLDYAAADPETEIVMAYLEGVQDGRAFFEAMKRCAAIKPTIVLKGGLTAAGARAAASHTGSLAGSREVFEALCRQTGAIRAETMDDLHDLVVAVSTNAKRVAGRGVALVAGGGGYAVLSADAIAADGLDLPPMPPSVVEQLREFIPVAGSSVNNPLDVFPRDQENMDRMLRIIAGAPGVDVVLSGATVMLAGGRPPRMPGPDDDEATRDELRRYMVEGAAKAAETMARLQEECGVPFIGAERGGMMMGFDGGAVNAAFRQAAFEHGVAVFPSLQRAARVLGAMLQWRERREGLPALF